MCCTFYESSLSNTILYAADTELDGRRVHVMAYQNKAKNLAKGANAMLLPIPAAAPLSPDNTIDARPFKGILSDYVSSYEMLKPKPRTSLFDELSLSSAPKVQVFNSGSYTVVLAKDARMIPAALARVPEERRPSPNRTILSAYTRFYPGWHMALCCYDGTIDAEPMVFWYEPLFPERLFAPALDAHDGNPPDLNAYAQRDHYLFFASKRARRGMQLQKKTNLNAVPTRHRSLFVDHFAGGQLTGPERNGDFWVDVKDIESGDLGFETLAPPGA